MSYSFQFGVLSAYQDLLIAGLITTIQLSLASIVAGFLLAVFLASLRNASAGIGRRLVDGYVEVIRNTPLLVQLFIIYFGISSLGFRIGEIPAAFLGLTINLGAYAVEIIRAGLESIPRTQIEAAQSLNMTRYQTYRHVIVPVALKRVYPALASQFVLTMLASSLCSSISTNELTKAATYVQANSFRSFEVYIAIAVVYLALALLLRGGFELLYRWMFRRRRSRVHAAAAVPS